MNLDNIYNHRCNDQETQDQEIQDKYNSRLEPKLWANT